eukprot:scaffold1535_cov382-Prasinococcus_capsulatus_cf.AAC.63
MKSRYNPPASPVPGGFAQSSAHQVAPPTMDSCDAVSKVVWTSRPALLITQSTLAPESARDFAQAWMDSSLDTSSADVTTLCSLLLNSNNPGLSAGVRQVAWTVQPRSASCLQNSSPIPLEAPARDGGKQKLGGCLQGRACRPHFAAHLSQSQSYPRGCSCTVPLGAGICCLSCPWRAAKRKERGMRRNSAKKERTSLSVPHSEPRRTVRSRAFIRRRASAAPRACPSSCAPVGATRAHAVDRRSANPARLACARPAALSAAATAQRSWRSSGVALERPSRRREGGRSYGTRAPPSVSGIHQRQHLADAARSQAARTQRRRCAPRCRPTARHRPRHGQAERWFTSRRSVISSSSITRPARGWAAHTREEARGGTRGRGGRRAAAHSADRRTLELGCGAVSGMRAPGDSGGAGPKLAFLFDMDGTLVDSDPVHLESFAAHFGSHGVTVDEHYFRENIHGRGNAEIFSISFPEVPEEERKKMAVQREKLYRSISIQKLKSINGANAFVQWAKSQGVAVAVVTNSVRDSADCCLDLCGLNHFFDVVVCGPECVRPKPYPEPYLEGASKINMPIERCIVFEDSPSGVKAGVAAKAAAVIGLRSTQTDASLRAAGAHYTVQDFSDPALVAFLKSLSFWEEAGLREPQDGITSDN